MSIIFKMSLRIDILMYLQILALIRLNCHKILPYFNKQAKVETKHKKIPF